MIKLPALLKVLIEAITSILPSLAKFLCLLGWVSTLFNDLKELGLREFLIVIDLLSLAFACSELQHQLVRILWLGFDPIRDLPILSEAIVDVCWVKVLRHRYSTLGMFFFHVIINLLDSSVPSLNNVSILIHLGEDLILFCRARDDFIDLVIIGYLTLLFSFLVVSIVLSDQILESLLSLHIRGLVIEHTCLNDLIVEVLLHCGFIKYAFFDFC